MPPKIAPRTQHLRDMHSFHELAEQYARSQKLGWTLTKEIFGTFIGVLPFLLLALGAWMNMSERVRVSEVQIVSNKTSHDQELANLKSSMESNNKQAERDRSELREALSRFSNQIEALQKEVATMNARGRR